MKLYIINNNQDLYHFCEGRKLADSLFNYKQGFYTCGLCDIKIPEYITFPFTVSNIRTAGYITFSRRGAIDSYDELMKLNPIVLEF